MSSRTLRPLLIVLLSTLSACSLPLGRTLEASEGADSSAERRGPLAMRVQNPVHLAFVQLPPAGARVLAAGDSEVGWTNQYSSLFRRDTIDRGRTRSLFDGEIWRSVASVSHGFGGGLQLAVRVPFLYGSGGFLDALVEDYHAWLGLTQEGRDENPDDRFTMELVKDQAHAYSMDAHRFAIADTAFELAWNVLPEDDALPGVTLRAAVELPTGDAARGYGNDAFDVAFGAAVEKEVLGFVLYGNANGSINGGYDAIRDADVGVRNTYSGLVGVERPLWSSFSAMAQVQMESSPVSNIDLEDPTDVVWLLTVGGVVDLSQDLRLHLAFAEDLTGKAAQDFTALIGFSYRF
ncbi:MAG: DUF3187 family protein [Planctomycetes bacterium]|nr:DUF3187 family protein [Planctomycetota bacterium]